MAKVQTIGFKALLVTIPTPAVPVKISPEQKFTLEAEVHNPTGNQVIYFGDADVSSSTHIPRAAGSTFTNTSIDMQGSPRHFDLSQLYILGTAGETVRVQYRINNPTTE